MLLALLSSCESGRSQKEEVPIAGRAAKMLLFVVSACSSSFSSFAISSSLSLLLDIEYRRVFE